MTGHRQTQANLFFPTPLIKTKGRPQPLEVGGEFSGEEKLE